MAGKVQGKHAAGAHQEGIGKDASGNTVLWTSDAKGAWTPIELKKAIHPGRIIAIVAGVLCACVLAVYLGGWWYFSNHAFPNTTMAGVDVSYKTSEELAQEAAHLGDSYEVKVTGAEEPFVVAAKDVGAGIDGSAVAAQVIGKRKALAWPLEMLNTHDLSGVVVKEFNAGSFEAKLREQIETYNETAREPENAYIEFDKENLLYLVKEGNPGTKLEVEPIVDVAKEAVATMQVEVAIPEDAHVKPKITVDDERLVKAATQANSLCRAKLDLVLGTTAIPAATIDATQISEWISISKKYKVKFDNDAMNAWINDLADGLNTVGTERSYTRSDGKEITVSGGIYGWEIDKEALVEQLRQAITGGEQGTITVPTFTEGATWAGQGEADWGAYADVDLSEQHARFYNVDGKLVWEADFVSGIPDGKHDTPTGVWRILYKESPATLKGEIQEATNQPEYETKVKYWMPFTHSGCGFHDATWQWAFGGTRYRDGWGSHGCINLSYDDAEKLYGLIADANAVVVHW